MTMFPMYLQYATSGLCVDFEGELVLADDREQDCLEDGYKTFIRNSIVGFGLFGAALPICIYLNLCL